MMKKRNRRLAQGEEGQSTVEFALTLILLMGFVLFYLQLSMVMAFGNYVHYATFMSARAYLAAGPSKGDQTERARQVIVRMLKKSSGQSGVDRFKSIATGDGGGDPTGFQSDEPKEFNARNPDSSWMQGVRYTFRSRLFLIPMGSGGASSGSKAQSSIILKSESWLGREPAYDECQNEMGRYHGIFDNGC